MPRFSGAFFLMESTLQATVNNQDTTSIRTLTPRDFAVLVDSVKFNWHVTLDQRQQSVIKQTVQDATTSIELDGIPAIAIIHRPSSYTDLDEIAVNIYDVSGMRLCTISMAESGLGNMRLVT